jgi:DNA polymerase I-like protein with 3'-5' exonuclease and polymerase domains
MKPISEIKYAVIDVETTIKNKGHPFTKSNRLCAVGIKDKYGTTVYPIEYDAAPYGEALMELSMRLDEAEFLVGFNIKFDLHWLRRYIHGLAFRDVFDCQLAQFLLDGQIEPYPSLRGSASKYDGLGTKLDRVQLEYWDLGIDTPEVPWDLLSEYCAQDIEVTEQLYQKQRLKLVGPMRRLFWLQCKDLLLLEEMEWNGLLYDHETARTVGQELQLEDAQIDEELRSLVGHPCVDLGSSDHISSVLYGGTIWEQYREQYTRELKDGTQKPKERWSRRPVEFPRLVKPLPRTELKPTNGISDKELAEINHHRNGEGKVPHSRHYSVSEPVLSKLPARGRAKRIIELILRKSRIRKLDSTYYSGLAAKIDEMEWSDGIIHGQLNQCVARTGRLSSSEPNEQNFDNDIKKLFGTRYT